MPTFKITRTYKYTTTEIVEAENEEGAWEIAGDGEEVLNNDDWMYDMIIKES